MEKEKYERSLDCFVVVLDESQKSIVSFARSKTFGTVMWVRFPPTGKRTAIITLALSSSSENS